MSPNQYYQPGESVTQLYSAVHKLKQMRIVLSLSTTFSRRFIYTERTSLFLVNNDFQCSVECLNHCFPFLFRLTDNLNPNKSGCCKNQTKFI